MGTVIAILLIAVLAYLVGWWRWWAAYVEELMSLGVDEFKANQMARKYFWHYIGKDALAHADRDFSIEANKP